MLGFLFSSSPAANAQGSTANNPGNTGSPGSGGSTGQDGYRISGDTDVAELSREYLYTREIPDGAQDVYWHVGGAATINGEPAANFPDSRLRAEEFPELNIQWSADSAKVAFDAQSGKTPFVLQLWRYNPESQTREILADVSFSALYTGHIEYFGLSTSPTSSGSTANQTLCPTPPVNPQFGTYPLYRYNFDSGNFQYFIWTLKYKLANGQEYQEQWLDGINQTNGDFPLFTQVPPYPYPTYYDAQGNLLSPRIMPPVMRPYGYTPPSGPVGATNPFAGQNVKEIVVECTGYGFFGCASDRMYVFYSGVINDPDDISVSAAAPYCRNQSVTFSTGGSSATSTSVAYNWSLSAGTISSTSNNGQSITVDLASVAPGASSITASVQTSITSNPCSGTVAPSATKTVTLQLPPAPATPQNLRLDGSCPSTTYKTLSIDPIFTSGAQPVTYRWFLSGANTANAQLIDNTTGMPSTTPVPDGSVTIRVITTNVGQFTVNVEAKKLDCNGASTALTRTFQIGDIVPTCPIVYVDRDPCHASMASLVLDGTPGTSYFITRQPYNISTTGTTVTIANGSSTTSTTRPITMNSSGRFTFDIDILATSPCPPASSSGAVFCTTVHLFVQKFIQGFCRGTGSDTGGTSASESATLLYPNPSTGQVSIQPEVPTQYQWVKVLNVQGQILLDRQASSPTGVTTFDVQALPTGLYEVQLFDGQRLTTQRLMKE